MKHLKRLMEIVRNRGKFIVGNMTYMNYDFTEHTLKEWIIGEVLKHYFLFSDYYWNTVPEQEDFNKIFNSKFLPTLIKDFDKYILIEYRDSNTAKFKCKINNPTELFINYYNQYKNTA